MRPLKILFIVHGYPPTAMAGTEICARRLCAALRRAGHEPFVILREERPGQPEYKIIRDELDGVPLLRVVNNFTRLEERRLYDFHPRIEEIVGEELARLGPDLVHIQHLAGASWGIPRMVKGRGIPLVVSLHDYWYACERVQLLRPDMTICPGPDGGRACALHCARRSLPAMAAAALERVAGAGGHTAPLAVAKRISGPLAAVQKALFRRRTGRLARAYGDRCRRLMGGLAEADILIAPSEKARAVYAALGVKADSIIVIPHGAPPPAAEAAAGGRAPYDGRRPLAVAYIGTIMPHKGIVTLLRAVRGTPPGAVTLAMHGRPYPERFARYVGKVVRRFPPGRVSLSGMYAPGDLGRILAEADILAIPSLWHETFNLVLWEAWAAGLPVIASRVGALSDFVRDGDGGLSFEPGDWRGLRDRIMRVARDPSLLARLRRPLPRFPMGVDENAARYGEVYAALLAGGRGGAARRAAEGGGDAAG
ncbi:MAG: glycosyltransferase [bacterium]|nr:glycosyltransferase [bacterium]